MMETTIESAVAKFTSNQLKGVRKFLFGSKTTARMMKMLPGILASINKITTLADVNDNWIGTTAYKQSSNMYLFSNALLKIMIAMLKDDMVLNLVHML